MNAFETLAHGKRFAGSGADIDDVGEMLGGYDITIAQMDVAAIHLHRQNRLRAGSFASISSNRPDNSASEKGLTK